jgi:hypothetical protein
VAFLLHKLKLVDEAGGIEERVVWMIPKSDRHPEGVRYRLAYIRKGEKRPMVLYDNHLPKGHHRHYGNLEEPYNFSDVENLLKDFGKDIEAAKWKH